VDQQLTYRNQSDDTLRHLIVNDWNNAYSSKTTPLAERFSDEFKRAFYYAREEERGFTDISHIISDGKSLQWKRPDGHPDLVSIQTDALFPGDSVMLFLRYKVKLPNKRFTRFGYDADGGFAVRDIFLLPALYRDGFRLYSNEDLDDAALARADIDLRIVVPDGWRVESDLTNGTQHAGTYDFTGNNRAGFSIYASKRPIFHSFRNSKTEVLNSLEDVRLDDITKAIL